MLYNKKYKKSKNYKNNIGFSQNRCCKVHNNIDSKKIDVELCILKCFLHRFFEKRYRKCLYNIGLFLKHFLHQFYTNRCCFLQKKINILFVFTMNQSEPSMIFSKENPLCIAYLNKRIKT